MPQNTYTYHITHICLTALLVWSSYGTHITTHTGPKAQQFATPTLQIINKYMSERNVLLKCHIYAIYTNYIMCRLIYTPYQLTAIGSAIRSTAIHTFYIILPHLICMPHCTNTIVYIHLTLLHI